ncbi:MAG: hypothetical protein WAV54_12840 [Acidimicrobiales bacterium]
MERADRLGGVDDDYEAIGRDAHQLFSRVGRPTALYKPAIGSDLVSSVNAEVESLNLTERLDVGANRSSR